MRRLSVILLQNEALKEALDLIGELGSNTEMAVVYKVVDKALGRVAEKRVEDCPNECRRCQAGIPDTFDARKNAWCLDCETYICPTCWAGHNAQYHGQTL